MTAKTTSIALLLAVLAGCGSDGSCTDAGCENDASIAFVGSRPEGPYDLMVELDADHVFMARCADPAAPENADNDPEIQCTLSGFSLVGDAATAHSISVTVIPVGMDALVENVQVLLSVVEERHPNGEDCPPTCYSRSGQLTLGAS